VELLEGFEGGLRKSVLFLGGHALTEEDSAGERPEGVGGAEIFDLEGAGRFCGFFDGGQEVGFLPGLEAIEKEEHFEGGDV